MSTELKKYLFVIRDIDKLHIRGIDFSVVSLFREKEKK